MRALVIVSLFWITTAKLHKGRDSRNIIGCHTTDFQCFKRQYRSLRDNFLLGNPWYGIEVYHPYTFKNSVTSTCVQLTGLEDSRLAGIRMDNIAKQFNIVLQLPFRITQIKNDTVHCHALGTAEGPLKRFVGNATIQATYPFRLKKKKGVMHLSLQDENLDVVLDIPDLSHYKTGSKLERKLYALSEWAFMVVQNVDAAQYFALPYTKQLRVVTEHIPLHKLIELYPDEEYVDLNFKFSDTLSKCKHQM